MKARITVLNKILKGSLVSAALLLEHFPRFAIRVVQEEEEGNAFSTAAICCRQHCALLRDLMQQQPWEL